MLKPPASTDPKKREGGKKGKKKKETFSYPYTYELVIVNDSQLNEPPPILLKIILKIFQCNFQKFLVSFMILTIL